MASLLSARRTGSDITLQATEARRPDDDPPPDPQPALPDRLDPAGHCRRPRGSGGQLDSQCGSDRCRLVGRRSRHARRCAGRRDPDLVARERRERPNRRHPGDPGALGRHCAECVHAVQVRRRGHPADARRRGGRTRRDQRGHDRRLPGTGVDGRGLHGRALAGAGPLGRRRGGARRVRVRGRQPRTGRRADRRSARLAAECATGRGRRPVGHARRRGGGAADRAGPSSGPGRGALRLRSVPGWPEASPC